MYFPVRCFPSNITFYLYSDYIGILSEYNIIFLGKLEYIKENSEKNNFY